MYSLESLHRGDSNAYTQRAISKIISICLWPDATWFELPMSRTSHGQKDVRATELRLYITKTRLFKYIENFTTKKGKFSDNNVWYVSYFCSKHRLWVWHCSKKFKKIIADSEQSSHMPSHSYQRYGELILYMQISLTIAWERREKNLSILGFSYTTYFTIVRVYTHCEDSG